MLSRGVRLNLRQFSSATNSVNLTTLSNGLRVITQVSREETVSVGVYLEAGSRHEAENAVGSARFIQSLAFNGSKKRPGVSLIQDINKLGGNFEVSMGREHSLFRATVQPQNIKAGFDILGDMVISAGGNLEEIEKNKAAVAEEVRGELRTTKDVILDRLHLVAFRDCGLGQSIMSSPEDVEKLTKETVKSYVKENFVANKMVVAATGAVNHDEVVAMAELQLGKIGKSPTPDLILSKPYFCGAQLIYRNDEMGKNVYFAVGWESVPFRSPEAVVFSLIQQIIGSYVANDPSAIIPGTMSGNRVINNMANRMNVGCVDEYQSFNSFYRDTGLLGVYAQCDEVALEHCIGEIQFGINMLSCSVTDEEIERAKRELKMQMFHYNKSSTKLVCDDLGQQILAYGRYVSPFELCSRLDALDSEEVKRTAWARLHDSEVCMTALGPTHGIPHIHDMRRANMVNRY